MTTSTENLKITNRPTSAQKAIRKGDALIVIRDNGTIHRGKATSDAYPLSGHTWVVHVEGISGCYDLTRCHKDG